MKKSVVVIVLAAMVLASCSQYTCPTYSKASKKQSVKQLQV